LRTAIELCKLRSSTLGFSLIISHLNAFFGCELDSIMQILRAIWNEVITDYFLDNLIEVGAIGIRKRDFRFTHGNTP
jgi:hypothetical protein